MAERLLAMEKVRVRSPSGGPELSGVWRMHVGVYWPVQGRGYVDVSGTPQQTVTRDVYEVGVA